jgi:hypothetical protein
MIANFITDWIRLEDEPEINPPLTCRDLFAMVALIGLCSTGQWSIAVAEKAYNTADAMMKIREAD